MLAIIGGSGLTQLAILEIERRQVVRTPFGEPSGPLIFGRIGDRQVVFLARHGYGHTIPPHLVNYRANIRALADAGVRDVVAVNVTGSIDPELEPFARTLNREPVRRGLSQRLARHGGVQVRIVPYRRHRLVDSRMGGALRPPGFKFASVLDGQPIAGKTHHPRHRFLTHDGLVRTLCAWIGFSHDAVSPRQPAGLSLRGAQYIL